MTSDSGRRAAVVTGGTSGIGKAIAVRFARAGYQVVLAGRDETRGNEVVAMIAAEGQSARFVRTDVARSESIRALAETVAASDGAPQVLVNAAGILQSGKSVLMQDEAENDELWRVNYKGTLLCCQLFGRLMSEAKRGAILNVGSLASLAPLSLPAYTPGKAAVWSLTQLLAAELGPCNVRVNAIAPGYTLSDGLKDKIAKGLRNPDAIRASAALGCFVLPEQVAEAAYFLCSDLAPTITGVMLPVDAGWLVQAPYRSYLQGNPIASGRPA